MAEAIQDPIQDPIQGPIAAGSQEEVQVLSILL